MTAAFIETRTVPIGDLTPFPGNARRGDVDVIRASLRRNGQYRSLVVRDDAGRLIVLAGNHTLKALIAESHSHARCEVIECDEATAQRINLADNRTAELGDYDDEALAKLLGAVNGDYDGTGWTEEDLAALLGETEYLPDGEVDIDDAPSAPFDPVSRYGDLWQLGRHRILCGDSTKPDNLAAVTGGGEPGIVYTDPPYGIAIVKKNGKIGSGGKFRGKIGSGKIVPTTEYLPVAGDETTEVARDAFALIVAEYPAARHIWWGGNHYAASAGLPDASCWLVWDKDNGANDFADAELAWTNHPGAVRLLRHMWNGMLRASERGKRVHPTQKPVALAEWAFSVVDPNRERLTVLDAFGGSGSTLLAAEQTGRTAMLIEMEPAYVDVTCRRFEQATGVTPGRVRPDGSVEVVSFTEPKGG